MFSPIDFASMKQSLLPKHFHLRNKLFCFQAQVFQVFLKHKARHIPKNTKAFWTHASSPVISHLNTVSLVQPPSFYGQTMPFKSETQRSALVNGHLLFMATLKELKSTLKRIFLARASSIYNIWFCIAQQVNVNENVFINSCCELVRSFSVFVILYHVSRTCLVGVP